MAPVQFANKIKELQNHLVEEQLKEFVRNGGEVDTLEENHPFRKVMEEKESIEEEDIEDLSQEEENIYNKIVDKLKNATPEQQEKIIKEEFKNGWRIDHG